MTNPVELCWTIYRAMGEGEKKEFGRKVLEDFARVSAGPGVSPAPASGGKTKVAAAFAEFSRTYYVRKIEGVDYSKDNAYAVRGDFLKPKHEVEEGELLFFGWKRPLAGFALLAVEPGAKAEVEADSGEKVILHDVRVVVAAVEFAVIKKALTEFFAP